MNSYKIVVGVDVSKNSFTATVLYDNKKENFEVKSDPYNVFANCNQKIEKFYSMNVNYLTKGGH